MVCERGEGVKEVTVTVRVCVWVGEVGGRMNELTVVG